MTLVDTIIRESVKLANSEYTEDTEKNYRASIQSAKHLNLQNISKEDVIKIVQPFLYKWGRMGRVLGRAKFEKWSENLAKSVSRNASLLQRYAVMDLSDVDLVSEKQHIGKLYESFKEVVGQVAATKCLHLFCPEFFPMWDTAIAEAARKERKAKGIKEFSPEDFYQFIKKTQGFINDNLDLISLLAKEYDKTKVKIVDEVFWLVTQRSMHFIFLRL